MSSNHRTQKPNLLGEFPLREDSPDCLSVCCWESFADSHPRGRPDSCWSDSLVVLFITSPILSALRDQAFPAPLPVSLLLSRSISCCTVSRRLIKPRMTSQP